MSKADGFVFIDTKLEKDEFSKGLKGIEGALKASMVACVAAVGTLSVAVLKVGSDYEVATAKVSTLVDENARSIDKISANMLTISSKTGIAATEVAEATYQALSAGISGTEDEMTSFVEKSARLAKAGFTSTASAVDIVTTAINGYGLKVSDADDITNQLIMTQNLGKTTVDQLSQTLGRVIPTASAFSVSLGNVNTAMAIMTASGINTAESSTYLKSMLNELGNTGSDVSKILVEKTGKSFTELMKEGKTLGDIMNILGESVDNDATAFANLWSSQEAGTGALTILNAGTSKYNDTLKKITGSTDAVDKAYKKVTDTFQEKSKIAQESLKNVGIVAYKKFEVPLKGAMDSASKAIDNLSKDLSRGELGESVDKLADGFGELITAGVDLASKAIPILVNGFAFLVDNSELVTVAIASVSSAMLYQKNIATITATVNTTIAASSLAYEVAQKVLAGSLTATAGAQELLNLAMMASPVGATAIAVGALTAGLAALVIGIFGTTDAHREQLNALNEEIESYKELKEQQKEQLESNLGEVENIQRLNGELGNLVDANGKVKEGYEARVNYIVGELNNALGLNMQLIDGEIQGYKDLSGSINDLIAKKRAEVILESQLTDYKEAVTKVTEAQIEANKTASEIEDILAQKKKLNAEKESVESEKRLHEINAEIGALEYSLGEKTGIYDTQKKIVEGYYNDITTYETNATLLASGNAEVYKQIQTDVTAKKGETTQGKIDQIAKEKEAEEKYLEFLQGRLAQATIEEQKKALQSQIENSKSIIKNKDEEMKGLISTVESSKEKNAMAFLEFTQKGIDAINSKRQESYNAGQSIANKSKEGASSVDASPSGFNFSQGFVNGITAPSTLEMLRQAGVKAATQVLFGLKKTGKENSPWKTTVQSGKFAAEGLAIGIENNAELAVDAVSELTKNVLKKFDDAELNTMLNDMEFRIANEKLSVIHEARIYAKSELGKLKVTNESNNTLLKAALDGNIHVHVDLDGRELAIAQAPLIAEELAFQ